MSTLNNLTIEPLSNDHNRPAFQCGVDALDRYIRQQAKQDIKRRISRVFIASQPDNPNHIMGYYTLSTVSIELNHLPDELVRKLPKHPIPAALIGRLAVDQHAQGQRIGEMLLADAIMRTLNISDEIAIYAMVVDAINDNAQRFYEKYGFSSLVKNNSRLFLPLKSI